MKTFVTAVLVYAFFAKMGSVLVVKTRSRIGKRYFRRVQTSVGYTT